MVSQALELGEDRIDLVAHPAMQFFDAENGVITTKLAKKGIVALRTTDGGITWTREDVLDDSEWSNIYLYLSRDGRLLTVTVPATDRFTVLRHD